MLTLLEKYHTVLDPDKGVCADPADGGAILGGGSRIPIVEQGASVGSGQRERKDVIHSEMKRRRVDKEDDPFTASECQHAQSKLTCIAGR